MAKVRIGGRPQAGLDNIESPLTWLSDHGLLWYLNKNIFHPCGMVLTFNQGPSGELDQVKLYKNSDKPVSYFKEKEFLEGQAKYQKFNDEIAVPAMTKRKSLLGWIVQKGPVKE